MERTITKKQLQALLKVCSKDTTRPVLMRLALRHGKLYACDGYVMVMLDLHHPDDPTTTLIDPDKLKMRLAVMNPRDGLTLADFKDLETQADLRYPDIEAVAKRRGEGDGTTGAMIDPEVLARACNAMADPTGEAIWNTTTTYNKSNTLTMTNELGDLAIVMGGSK